MLLARLEKNFGNTALGEFIKFENPNSPSRGVFSLFRLGLSIGLEFSNVITGVLFYIVFRYFLEMLKFYLIISCQRHRFKAIEMASQKSSISHEVRAGSFGPECKKCD